MTVVSTRRGRAPLTSLAVVAILTALVAATFLPAAAAPEGLVASWSFDSFDGSITPDGSGSGYDATVKAATQTKGVAGAAVHFDGTQSSVECGRTGPSLSSEALSLEAWVKLDTAGLSGFPTIIRKDGFYALRFGDGTLGFLLWFDGNPVRLETGRRAWEPGRWYHFAGVYDGSSMSLYIDGVPVGTAPAPRVADPIEASPEACLIGGGPGRYPFTGAIDEVYAVVDGHEVRVAVAGGADEFQAVSDLGWRQQEHIADLMDKADRAGYWERPHEVRLDLSPRPVSHGEVARAVLVGQEALERGGVVRS